MEQQNQILAQYVEQTNNRLGRIERLVKVPLHRRQVSKSKGRKAEVLKYLLKVVFEIAVRLFLNTIMGG